MDKITIDGRELAKGLTVPEMDIELTETQADKLFAWGIAEFSPEIHFDKDLIKGETLVNAILNTNCLKPGWDEMPYDVLELALIYLYPEKYK